MKIRKTRYVVEVSKKPVFSLHTTNLITKTTDILKNTEVVEEWHVYEEKCPTGADCYAGYGHNLSGMVGRAKPDNRAKVAQNVRKVLHALLACPEATLHLASDAEIITA